MPTFFLNFSVFLGDQLWFPFYTTRFVFRSVENWPNRQSFVNMISEQWTASQFVIPAKSGGGGREPGSRNNLIILYFHWIPDLAPQGGARPE